MRTLVQMAQLGFHILIFLIMSEKAEAVVSSLAVLLKTST